ncbi:MAG: hypothetical protein CM1200mP16_05330 [Nitrospina sp.]|nr:MAG: hypothetical protein CM1200mP16_05330 [Nitrospina sp.]
MTPFAPVKQTHWSKVFFKKPNKETLSLVQEIGVEPEDGEFIKNDRFLIQVKTDVS